MDTNYYSQGGIPGSLVVVVVKDKDILQVLVLDKEPVDQALVDMVMEDRLVAAHKRKSR